MLERLAKGVKNQLIGLNLWVIAFLFIFALTVIPPSIFQFFIAFIIFGLLLVGLVLFVIGLIFIISGSRNLRNKRSSIIGLILLSLSPFIIIGGFFNIPPMNYIIIHIGLWMLLSSFILPYLKIGGLITGLIAMVVETTMLVYTLVVILYGQLGITMPVLMSLIGGYFLFLELSIILSYLKVKNIQAEIQLVERESGYRTGLDVVRPAKAVNAPDPSASRARVMGGSEFRVVELEVPGRTHDTPRAKDPQRVRRSRERAPTPSPRKGPVVGRVLDLEDAMKRARSTPRGVRDEPPKAPPSKDEKYTVEDEEEIDLSFEDLYIDGQTLYEILKIEITASSIEVHKAYRKRAVLFHPDKNREMGPRYAETIGREMRKINTAKDILRDPAKRSVYDRMLNANR